MSWWRTTTAASSSCTPGVRSTTSWSTRPSSWARRSSSTRSLVVVGSMLVVVVVARGRRRRRHRVRGRRSRHRLGEHVRAVPARVRPGIAQHVPGVLGDGHDEAAARAGQQVGVVRVHQRVAAAGRDPAPGDGRPRAPRVVGDVDRQVVAPVAVDLGDRDPAAVDEPRLHRVLGPVAVDDRHRRRRVGRPPVGRAVRRSPRRAHRAAPGPGTSASPSTGRRGSHPGGRGSGRTSCRTGTCGRRRWPRRSRRSGGRPTPAPAGTTSGPACPRRTSPATSAPAPSRARRAASGSAVLAISAQKTRRLPPLSSPPSGQNQRLRICSPVPGSNDCRRRRRAPVEQREAATVLHHRRVVGERRLVEPRGVAGVVDERVLEQPQRPAAAQRVDVLVVEADDRADAVAEERVERGRRRALGAADVGGEVAGRRDRGEVGVRRPRRRCRRLGRWDGPGGRARRAAVARWWTPSSPGRARWVAGRARPPRPKAWSSSFPATSRPRRPMTAVGQWRPARRSS